MTEPSLTYRTNDAMLANIRALQAARETERRVPSVPTDLTRTINQSKETYEKVNRGLTMVTSSAAALGLLADDGNEALMSIRRSLLIIEAGFAAYAVIHGLVVAQTAIELALAASETTIRAATGVGLIVVAAAAASAAAVYAGLQFASGEWTLPAVNIDSRADRARAASDIKRVSTGG